VAKRDGRVVWQPEGEWKWRPLPDAATPAGTAADWLVQMRALAQGFTVEVLDKRNEPKGKNQTPRLLATPLYRYDAERTRTLDGALYAFVLGTDPELMVLLECDTAAAKPEWRFGVGRMNWFRTSLKRKGQTVWEAAEVKDNLSPEGEYLWLYLGLPRESRNDD
jgi:hypothetical protein